MGLLRTTPQDRSVGASRDVARVLKPSCMAEQGVHVHDVIEWNGSLWACGSGSTPEEWEAGDIHALIFRGDLGAEDFEVAARIPNNLPVGDTRFTNLAVLDGTLHAFGYRSDAQQIQELIAYRAEGEEWLPWDAFHGLYVLDIQPLGDDRALAMGPFLAGGVSAGATIVDSSGHQTLDAMAGRTLLDGWPLGDGRILTLSIAGDSWPPTDGDLAAEIGVLEPDGTHASLVQWDEDVLPSAVAWWRGGLYVGLEDGRLLRTSGSE